MLIEKPTRKFVQEGLVIRSWESVQSYFNNLLERDIQTKKSFTRWLEDMSELEAILEEDLAWRYIKMTINTKDEKLSESYKVFVTEIQPEMAPFDDLLNKKLIESPYVAELANEEAYAILFKKIRRSLELYREENIPLNAKDSEESQKYGSMSAAQTIEHEGKQITMQRASMLLKEQDEALRKLVFEKIANRRREDIDAFDELFDELIAIRQQIAINAGHKNYRDYKLDAMGRFDYTVEDCKNFHAAVKREIVPIAKKLQQEKLAKFGKEKFSPWDLDVDPEGKLPLKPFETGRELLEGSIEMFSRIDSYFADCLSTMDKMHHLDLESKDGKSPGGYNYPLYEIGVPFIFMNAVGSQRDLVTMVHEGGHAVHSFLSRDLPLTGFKSLPSEVAELASMSMELLTMNHWDVFYSDKDELNRAKREQLEGIIKIMPWIAQVDEFQHWIYENHGHSRDERKAKWKALNKEYGSGLTDWTGFEDIIDTSWQRQLHIFEVPFYYIEYGIAQLGAIGVWKNSIENKSKAIEQYKSALKLAYTKSIPNIYKTAGIPFDFSDAYLKEIAEFIDSQLKSLD